MAFDLRVLSPNPVARQRYLAIMQAALEAVDPYHAVRHQLRRDAATLWVGNRSYDLGKIRKVWVVGAGKAGAPMAQAAEDVLGDALAGGLVIVKRGHMAPTRRVTLVRMSRLHPIPPEIQPARRVCRDKVYLFPGILAHIANPQVAGQTVKRKPPGIAQAERPDLGGGATDGKGISGRDGVWVTVIHIQPQDFSEQGVARLGIAIGVAA